VKGFRGRRGAINLADLAGAQEGASASDKAMSGRQHDARRGGVDDDVCKNRYRHRWDIVLNPLSSGVQNEFHWVINKLNGHNVLGFSTRLHSYTTALGTRTASPYSLSFLGRKVSLTHARKPAQHPWFVPGAYTNSEAAPPAMSGLAALCG